MKKIKVLFQSYNTCMQNEQGGVKVKIENLEKMLQEKNIKVDYFNPFTTKIKDYDIVHIFRLDTENENFARLAHGLGKKVIVSATIKSNFTIKNCIYKFLTFTKLNTEFLIMKKTLNYVDLIIVETQKEKEYINKMFNYNPKKIIVIPNGFFPESNDMKSLESNKKEYVIQVGRFDKNKNQLNVIKAVKNTNIELFLIGGPVYKNDKYYNHCLKEANNSKNIHFTGWLDKDSSELKSLVKNAKTLILPSYSETFGMVAVEASSVNTNVVLSNKIALCKMKPFNRCITFNPSKISDIRKAILKSFDIKENTNFFEYVRENYSWDKIISKYIEIYERIIFDVDNN